MVEVLRAAARQLGFVRCAIADATEPLAVDAQRYERFLERGFHETMPYLAAHRLVRRALHEPTILEGAKSVLVLAARYQRSGEADDPTLAKHIARYARGRDYHKVLTRQARELATIVEGMGAGVRTRVLCDTAPVLERAWAARAGVGFIGKNGMLIVPGEGSYVLLCEIVTTLALPPDRPLVPAERCGSCRRCLDGCPTQAFAEPYVLDPRRCLAGATIEQRGHLARSITENIGHHLFGCDVCQELCPYNAATRPDTLLSDVFAPLPRWATYTLEDLAQVGMPDGPAFDDVSAGSPLRRAKAEGIARNACHVLGALGLVASCPTLERIALGHPSEMVRASAQGALERLRGGEPPA